jgi:hypothetical protein
MSTAALAEHRILPLAVAGESPALRLLPTTVPGPVRPARPELRVLEGGRAPARLARRATYRRRRLLVAVLLVAAVAAVTLLVGAISTGLAGGGHPSTAAGASSPTSAVPLGPAEVAASHQVVVQPGDTLWSIAATIAPPHADVRATVDQLVALNGHGPLTVGEHLRLP